MHLENMTEEQLEKAGETAEENQDTITVVERNGNTESKKNRTNRKHKHKHKLRKPTSNTKINENKNDKPYIALW